MASRYDLKLVREDREIVALGALLTRSEHQAELLTYATSEVWAAQVAPQTAACVVPAGVEDALPASCAALVTDRDPADAFYEILATTVDEGRWETLETRRGEELWKANSAVIHANTQIGDGCRIMDGAVILPGTRLGDRVTVKPNAVIGGEGFQVRTIRGRRRIVPHAGGVDIGDDCSIGSQTCVDRGLFGDATTLKEGVMVDNLIHIAHSAWIGANSSLIACCEVSGSVTLGRHVWVGPNAAINPGLRLGDHCYIGTGATVVRDIPAHALAYGSPAKPAAWICECYTKLPAGPDVTCSSCGRHYDVEERTGPTRVG